MVKKIVDVPDNATTIAVLENNDAVFGTLNISVSGLPDAPEKRVIELPADVIAELKTIKEDNGDDNLQGFMNDVNDDDEVWDDVKFSEIPTDAILGEWWLGHVEFVPKKEPEFVVMLPVGQWYQLEPAYFMHDDKGLNSFIAISDLALRMSEEEADKLAGGLEAFNAQKVKVED